MATPSRHTGEHYFAERVQFADVALPASSIGDNQIASSAAIDADKLQHIHARSFSQPNTAATSETRVVHVVVGTTGTVRTFSAGSIAKAVGDSTVTVDLRKNGTTMLTGVITLDNANTNRVVEAGTLAGTPSVVAGDVLEIVTVATVGTGTLPTGVFAHVTLDEAAS